MKSIRIIILQGYLCGKQKKDASSPQCIGAGRNAWPIAATNTGIRLLLETTWEAAGVKAQTKGNNSRVGTRIGRARLRTSQASLLAHLILRFGHTHQHVLISDGDKRCQSLHCTLEVCLEDNLSGSVDEGS